MAPFAFWQAIHAGKKKKKATTAATRAVATKTGSFLELVNLLVFRNHS